MSHNRRTLQDVDYLVLERPLTQPNGGTGVRMVAGVTPEAGTEFCLSAGHFGAAGPHRGSRVPPSLPEPLRKNKTDSLVTWEGHVPDGD